MDRRLRLSLVAVHLVGLATLLRSIAYDRWITVLASLLLITGAFAAQRGRTWGVALAFASAVAFPVAWMIGIAPSWFCLVGAVGAWPFMITSRAFARFDKGATVLLTAIAATLGALGAIGWKEYAWDIFSMIPATRPSIEAQHGFGLAMVTATAAIAMVLARRNPEQSARRLRVAEHVRIAETSSSMSAAEEDESDEVEARAPRRAVR